jgi:hypothetical protein
MSRHPHIHTLSCVTEVGGRLVCKEGVKVTRNIYPSYRRIVGQGTTVAPPRTSKSDAALNLFFGKKSVHGHRKVESHGGGTYHLPLPPEDRERYKADLAAIRAAAKVLTKEELTRFLVSHGVESGLHNMTRNDLATHAEIVQLEEWWPEKKS